MNTAELVMLTGLITQFIKKAFLALFKREIAGTGAIVLSAVCGLGAVLYKAIETGTAIGLNLIPLAITVIVGANAGYSLLKVARTPSSPEV
jgi:hypothetical protein